MAMSNKPIIWLPFAAGGMVVALVLPALMLLVLLVGLDVFPADTLGYDRVQAFAAHPLGALALFVVLGLALWHAAHRLRMTAQDLGVRRAGARKVVAGLCYLGAALLTAALIYALVTL